MKTAHNEVAVDLDLATNLILIEEVLKEVSREARTGDNVGPKNYRVVVSEEFQENVGKLDHPPT